MEVNFPGNTKLPPFKFGPWMVPFIVLILAFSAVGSLFYQVGPDEVGIVQQFGKYVRTTQPGLRMKLPFGIETVRKVKITHVFKEEFGFRTISAGVRSIFEGRSSDEEVTTRLSRSSRHAAANDPFLAESLMLTGDLNMAVVEWIVQYRVKDPVAYAFRIREPQETLRNMSEAVMRLVVGDHNINQILTAGREQIQKETEEMLQEVLNSYGAGIEIRNVILQDVNPPDEVKASFNEVNEARQEKEKLINQAWEEYNRIIPKAEGEAQQQIREAEGYAVDRVNRAQGDAERFILTWEAYRQSPVVTRQRLYLEAMQKTLPQLKDKWIMDESQKGLLPFLNLNAEPEGQVS